MSPSLACIDLVKEFEGCRLEAYRCPAGIPTIGYGHTRGVKMGDRITRDRAEELLREDLQISAGAVEAAIHTTIEQHQFDALVSFAFNCKGWSASTLLKLVNAGKLEGAANEFPKWIYAGKKVLAGLVRRREAERKLFTGEGGTLYAG